MFVLVFSLFVGTGWGQLDIRWKAPDNTGLTLDVITPEGEVWTFGLQPAPSMSPGLRQNWPGIEAWEGGDLAQTGKRISIVRYREKSRGFISWMDASGRHVVQRFGDDRPINLTPTVCETSTSGLTPRSMPVAPAGGPVRCRVLRLALACTGEYAAFHGGTVEAALAAMVEAVNRANAVFGPETGVQFALVAGNGDLVFTDPQTDPFSNVNAAQMLDQNQSLLNTVLGPDGYDIGHVFGTGTSSIAGLASACGSNKGRGVSRSNTPTGEAFEVGQFCHELGHQLGANHTHSNPCNAHLPAAFEPGSGSTIMSYAGLCAPNLQPFADDEFHAHSLQEIRNFLNDPTGNGALCPSPEGEPNHPPELMRPPLAHPIPPATPFSLRADGAVDADFDMLTYSWEQKNAGDARFRSFPPGPSPKRTFPADAGTGGVGNTLAESLPEAGQTLSFVCTVRDNHPTRGACAMDTLDVYVPTNSEPFAVESWGWSEANDSVWLTWQPGTTNSAPFHDSLLEARLSNDGGSHYTIPWADSIPNTGSIVLPWPPSLNGGLFRLQLAPMHGIYFSVSPDELDATASPNPIAGIDLAVMDVQGISSDTLCGHAIAPRAVVRNFGSAPANGFMLLFEDAVTGLALTLEYEGLVLPGQTVEHGPSFHPDHWWAIGYGHHVVNCQVLPLNPAQTDANPANNSHTQSLYTHCTAACPGCGCTSPAACNYLGDAIFPNENACELPPFGGACPCSSNVTMTATLGGGDEQMTVVGDLEGVPGDVAVTVGFNNGGSAGSLVADLAFNLCAPSGNCITVGGYNATLPGVNVGPWPISWMSLTSGTYDAVISWPEGLSTQGESSEWAITLLNGWQASGNVQYEVSVEINGLCSPGLEGAGCPGDLNEDATVNVADLLVLLGALGCQWDCLTIDLTGDGSVNIQDLLGFLGSLGLDCP